MTLPPAKNTVYVIAEAGVNHNGDPPTAERLIDIAARAGADAVKFQLFDPEEIASEQAPLAAYQEQSGEQNQQAMLQRLVLPAGVWPSLKARAERQGLDFIVTPFDIASARFLADLGVQRMKIPSGELTNLPFLTEVAALKKPT